MRDFMSIPPVSGSNPFANINPDSSETTKAIWQNLQRNFSSFYIHCGQLDHYFAENPTGANVAPTDIASRMADLVSVEWTDMKSDVGELMKDTSSSLYTDGALNETGKTFQSIFQASQHGQDLMSYSFLFQAIKNPTESVGNSTYSQMIQNFLSSNSTTDGYVLELMSGIYPALEKGNEAPSNTTINKKPFPQYIGGKPTSSS